MSDSKFTLSFGRKFIRFVCSWVNGINPTESVSSSLSMTVSEAEYETRDGREYYDVGGTLTDGSEVELDMTKVDGAWTVVEIQRDIDADALPAPVAAELASALPDWSATRIIESEQAGSDQGDGTVIYEFFGQDTNGAPIKHEIKWVDGEAALLDEEWAH